MSNARRSKPVVDPRGALTPELIPLDNRAKPTTAPTTAPTPDVQFEAILFQQILFWKRKAEIADERARRAQDNFAKYRTKFAIKALAKKLVRGSRTR